MRSNVAELDKIVGETIANENDQPRIAVGQNPTVVAGLRFTSAVSRQEAIGARRKLISYYKEDREALIARYAAHNVTPMAIIPRKTWDRITEEAKLYKFKPDPQGKVIVNTDTLRYYEWVAAVMDAVFWTGLWGIYFFYAITMVQWGNVYALGTVCTGITMAVVYIVFANMKPNPFIQLHRFFAHMALLCANRMPHAWKMRRLFPGRRGVKEAYGASHHQATLVLPTPPDDVADTLSRITGIKGLRLAIVEQGFRVAEPFSNLLNKELKNRTEDRERRWEYTLLLDPIVYDVKDSAVAIIAQFGDFPVEKEIIERICATPKYLF